MKVCILSENSNGVVPWVHYRNLGASEVSKRLYARNIECTTVEWFTHWDQDDLYNGVKNYLSDTDHPVIAISVPFVPDDIYKIKDVLFRLKKDVPNLTVISGGNRTYDKKLSDVVDYFFIGRSMEIFESWLDGKDLSRFMSKQSNVYLNRNINVALEDPVLPHFGDADFLNPNDVLGFELGIGCRFNCAFCNFDLRKMHNPKMANADKIAATLNELYSKYGVYNYFITDDTINESIDKMQVLADVVSKLNFKINLSGYCRLDLLESPKQQELWQKINLAGVFFGIETFNPESSKLVRKTSRISSQIETLKKLRQLTPNTFLSCGMIIGLTGDSREHILDSMEFVSKHNLLDCMQYNVLNLPEMETDVFDDYMLSDMSKYPEKFGYTITGKIPRTDLSIQSRLSWVNEWCDSDKATEIYQEVRQNLKGKNLSNSDAFEYLSFLSLGVVDEKESVRKMEQVIIAKSSKKADKLRAEYIEKKTQFLLNS
jgi:hypothetical protein